MGMTAADLLEDGQPYWRLYTLPEALDFYRTVLDSCADDPYTHREWRRRLVLTDLFYLLVYELNRPDAAHPWLYARCREVENDPDGVINLWAREHYKSSIITFAQNIQEILKNPQVTIGLISHTKAIAEDKFLAPIKTELETNPNLYYLFPEVLYENPDTQSPHWNASEIQVKRTGTIKEKTIEAHGIMDGMPTGSHFDILHYDDLITEKHVTSPEMVKKATANWELSLSLGKEGGRQRYVGTFYAMQDTYSTIIERGAARPRAPHRVAIAPA